LDDTNTDSLAATLAKYEIELAATQIERLEAYCRLLWEVNESLNLTRHTDYERFVTRDLIDSIQLANLIESEETVLDVGTGGGVPGIVISILRPDVTMTLCDSVAKKARAVAEIISRMELPIPVVHGSVQDILQDHGFHVLIARAVAPLSKLLKWLTPHWGNIGRLLALKGSRWAEERGEARHYGLLKGLQLRRAATYQTPGTDAENVVLKIWSD
jgi:16S rRNA (guanine527-N7)-methyltransferase